MIYKSSSGDKEIATMPLSYALNAMRKLERTDPSRTDEISALKAHTDGLIAENKANTEPEAREAVIGDNGGPALEPVESEGRAAVEAHVDDLLTEASNWADGVALENQDQADAVGKLHRMLQEAVGMVDDRAAEEKKSLQEAVNEIAAWANGFVAKGLKKTPDGKLTKAILATSNLTSGWLQKQEAERKAKADALATEAAKAAQEAIAQRQEAKKSTDIAEMDKADDALETAKALIAQAEGASKEKVRATAGDGYRAITLRSVWSAEITDNKAAIIHYMKAHPQAFIDLAQGLADKDARNEATRRDIPGVKFTERKVAN